MSGEWGYSGRDRGQGVWKDLGWKLIFYRKFRENGP